MLSRLSPGVRAALAALGVVIGVALIFVGLDAFQPESTEPRGVVVPDPSSGSVPPPVPTTAGSTGTTTP